MPGLHVYEVADIISFPQPCFIDEESRSGEEQRQNPGDRNQDSGLLVFCFDDQCSEMAVEVEK